MQLQVKVPKSLQLKQIIVQKYTYLYKEYRRYYPERKDYTYQQLRQNIADVASIVNAQVDIMSVKNTTFVPWIDKEWKQLYFSHWYFAVTIESLRQERVIVVHDAHYEGDHHNDELLSKPYDEDDIR